MTSAPVDTELELDATQVAVIAWRAQLLARAGFDTADAFALAENPGVDLHQALYLIEAGCPLDTALRILT